MNKEWLSTSARSIVETSASLVAWFALLSITSVLLKGTIAEIGVQSPLDTLVWGVYAVLFTLGYVITLRKMRRLLQTRRIGP